MKKDLTILLTGEGYIASRWLQSPSSQVKKIIRMQGRIPSVDPSTLLDNIDIVLHCAGISPPQADNDPTQYDVINRQWTALLGHACAARGVRIFFPSGSNIYNAVDGALLAEDTRCINPQDPYAQSKYDAEVELRALASQGLRSALVRFGSVFGAAPRISFDRVVNKFVRQAYTGAPLTLWGPALKQLHPYTYVGDVAKAINFVIEHDLFDNGIYNVVSENATLGDIVEHIRNIFPSVTVTEIDHAGGFSFGMDDTKIRALGFSPEGTLAQGIAEVAAALRG